jgi:hypothetical protein
MHPIDERSSGSGTSLRTQSWADYTIDMVGSEFFGSDSGYEVRNNRVAAVVVTAVGVARRPRSIQTTALKEARGSARFLHNLIAGNVELLEQLQDYDCPRRHP